MSKKGTSNRLLCLQFQEN